MVPKMRSVTRCDRRGTRRCSKSIGTTLLVYGLDGKD